MGIFHLLQWSQGPGTPESGPKRHRQLSGSPGPTLLILFCSEKRTWRGNLFPPHVSIRRLRISTIPRSYEIMPGPRLHNPFLRSPAVQAMQSGLFSSASRTFPEAQTDYRALLVSAPSSPPANGSRHTLRDLWANKHCTISKRGDSLSRPTSDVPTNTISFCTMSVAVAGFKRAGNPAHANGLSASFRAVGFRFKSRSLASGVIILNRQCRCQPVRVPKDAKGIAAFCFSKGDYQLCFNDRSRSLGSSRLNTSLQPPSTAPTGATSLGQPPRQGWRFNHWAEFSRPE